MSSQFKYFYSKAFITINVWKIAIVKRFACNSYAISDSMLCPFRFMFGDVTSMYEGSSCLNVEEGQCIVPRVLNTEIFHPVKRQILKMYPFKGLCHQVAIG
jgi:hypothetical protein